MPAFPDVETVRSSFSAALSRDDPRAALELLFPVAHVLAVEHGGIFRDLVAELPAEIWHDTPAIAAAMGTSYRTPGSPRGSSALAYFRAAEAAVAENPETVPLHCRVAVLVAHATALRTQGRLNDALEKVEHAGALLDANRGMPHYVTRAAHKALEHGLIEVHLGRLDQAARRLEYAGGLAQTALTHSEHIEALGGLALVAYNLGELEECDRLVAEGEKLDESGTALTSPYGAPLLVAQVLCAVERHDPAVAIEAGSRLAVAAARSDWEAFSYVVDALAKVILRSPIAALDQLQRARQQFNSWRPASFGLDIGELVRAQILAKLDHGDEAFTILSRLDPHERHALCPARYIAQLRLAHGDLRGASDALADCEELGALHSPRTFTAVQLLRGAIEFERGNLTVSDVSVDRALLAMARTGVRSPLEQVPAPCLLRVAQRALTRPQPVEVERILQRIVEATDGEGAANEPLSERERDVLTYVERELTVSAIAAELFISPNTVKTHLRRLYRKLGVTTREEAIRTARSLGLQAERLPQITPESPGRQDGPESGR